MKIAIVGINYYPEPIGIGPFTAGLAQYLVSAGDDVVVHTAVPFYPGWSIADGYHNRWSQTDHENVHVTRSPIYIPAHPTGLKRILHLLSFSVTGLFPVLCGARRQKPDVVLCVVPSLMSVPLAWLAAKIVGARLWVHVQDFEAAAAVATGLLAKGGGPARFAQWLELYLLKQADFATSISAAMCRRLEDGGVSPSRIYEFRNWADIDWITPLDRPSLYREKWGITAPHVALYSGNIAKKQGIELIVEAAERLRHRDDLQFVICGNGANRDTLIELAQAKGTRNIIFQDLQPRENLSELLGLATVHLLPQLADAADLVLPSKLANMLASGRPVVATADAQTALAQEVAGCGLVVPPGDAVALSGAIEQLLDDPASHERFGTMARERALGSWSKTSILAQLRARLMGLVSR